MDKETYYKHLSRVQNHARNAYQDIMTITGLMDNTDKIKHLRRYAALTKDKEALDYTTQKLTGGLNNENYRNLSKRNADTNNNQ